jgi:DNA topoisomerase-2
MESSNLSKQYQKKTDKEHILDNPDTYIGSVENVDSNLWLYNNNKIITKSINYIPGLYKLFDEGVVNCRDHVIRMQQQKTSGTAYQVSKIEISVDDDGTIHMLNDGNGIDIAKHPEYDLWIPEMIFGHLRTSTNYNKDEKKIVGGKNGFGFKLVLIWSVFGEIETIDHIRKLKYVQKFSNNLDNIEPPKITKCSAKPYTRVSFKPDYSRFGIPTLNTDMRELFHKRVIDVSAITPKTVKVKYNNELIPVKTFEQYIDLYIGSRTESLRVHENPNERWEYCVALSPSHEFQQVSFVNGIHTVKGGKHVDYVLNQITKKMVNYIEKKKKVTVNANTIKEQLFLFIRCDIENPAFDSQTKDYMNTPMAKFGSSCTVSDKFIEKLAKMGVMESACAIHEIKENKNAKKSDGSKSKNVRGIPKLVDANWAGGAKSYMCTIIFCEGDSAKAGIVSGLSSEDRNMIGVYPMKGKILNVRGELSKKILENKEIIEIKKILGLEANRIYDTIDSVKKHLRYGKILFMTDQDLDGSHIKGLGINLFQCQWNQLSKLQNFIGFMNTPILKARKNNKTLLFYNDGEYEKWKQENDTKGWKIKYYKGLGTSTGSEFKEYFANKKIVYFNHEGNNCDNAVDMVFNKKRADDRKSWLGDYDRKAYLDTNRESITYSEFINKEMIHFSKYDCERSIPNLMDGLKISLRKILYSAFKKNLNQEIKVAQFSGYVSEHSGYHHGEASLNSAIVGLAQDYIGSNNINLFLPNGQFGTRLQGGKDSASERYIFTQLHKITRSIFPQSDDAVLEYLDDDGLSVEPRYYAPIIPMILVNGSKGIGTGFSTDILPYNPITIIEYLKNTLQNKTDANTSIEFHPYYHGFTGGIMQHSDNKYLITGKYQVIGANKIRVTELPVGLWTDDFKQHLDNLTNNVDKNGKKIQPIVKDIDDMSKTTNIDFVVTFHGNHLQILESNTCDNGCNGLEKTLKLYSSVTTTNMHMFDANDKLKKYDKVSDIIDDYYITRLELYQTRKDYLIKQKTYECSLLENKSRYIKEILNETIDLRKKKKDVIIKILQDKNYQIFDEDEEYKYLLKMSMDSVSEENVQKLLEEYETKSKELEIIKSKSIEKMWLEELVHLEKEYKKYFTSK